MVQKEFEHIATTFQQVSQLRSKFADFDIAGKEMYSTQVSVAPLPMAAACAFGAQAVIIQ